MNLMKNKNELFNIIYQRLLGNIQYLNITDLRKSET